MSGFRSGCHPGPARGASRAIAHERGALFGALGDSAPDRWGRRLIARNEAIRARAEKRTPRAPREIDFLLGVTDVVRQGALRFRAVPDGPFVATDDGIRVPPLIELPALLSAATVFSQDPDALRADDAVRLLLAPGSSLGGARPKASVLDRDGALAIAKFPESSDEIDVIRWEHAMLLLARRAGIESCASRLEAVGSSMVLLVRRFDRRGTVRVRFLSAMSLLDAADGERGSYVELFDALRRIGTAPAADGAQLWRRLVFNILASNFDDHLRNHAILHDGSGWRLAPAYDLNPVPAQVRARTLSTAIHIDGDPTASIELAIDAAPEFLLKKDDARAIAAEVASVTATWRRTAARLGIDGAELEEMRTAFEHSDARVARGWG